MTRSPAHWNLSWTKLGLLDRYHGQPTGMFAADEHLAGRNPSRGTELCSIVETIYSLNVMSQVQGSVAFIDRAERIAFNALPAALTADMWAHNYLSTINEVQAADSPRHLPGDNANATIYGLADRFTGVTPCCTANHNQGWPKLAMATVLASPAPDNGIVVSVYAPVNATMPARVGGGGGGGGGRTRVSVVTDYPFGDDVTVIVTTSKAATTRDESSNGSGSGSRAEPAVPSLAAVPLWLRIPEWATNATVSVNGATPVRAVPATYHRVLCPAAAGRSKGSVAATTTTTTTTTVVHLALNPEIVVETGWGGYNGTDLHAAVVVRGPLLYALGLDETPHQLHEPWACFETGCSRDLSITSNGTWNYALVLPPPASASWCSSS